MMLMYPPKCTHSHTCTFAHFTLSINVKKNDCQLFQALSLTLPLSLTSIAMMERWRFKQYGITNLNSSSSSMYHGKKPNGEKNSEKLVYYLFCTFFAGIHSVRLTTFNERKALWVLLFNVCLLFFPSLRAKFQINLPLCLGSVFHSVFHSLSFAHF